MVSGFALALSFSIASASNVVDGVNNFSFALLQQANNNAAGKNVVLSPFSAYSVFALLYPGASGDNKKQLQKVFQFPASLQDVKILNNSLEINSDSGNGLWLANSAWKNYDIALSPNYEQTIAKYFTSKILTVNFAKDKGVLAANKINTWILGHTNNMIDNMLMPSDVYGNKLVLVNALYFQAAWLHAFTKHATKNQKFFVGAGRDVEVPMMTQTNYFYYLDNSAMQMLQLPYYNAFYSMLIILPKPNISLTAVISSLNAKKLSEWQQQAIPSRVHVQLPKVNLIQQANLNALLQSMGVVDAFSGDHGLAFTGLSKTPLVISKVLQQTHLELDEQGTKAAAATTIGMMTMSMGNSMLPKPIDFNVNRPYLLLLKNNKTGAIVFMAALINPKLM
jgi:serine protease inhibitor